MIIVLLSLILGVTSFSWLHSRKKVDFYHSLPVRREKLFFVNYLDGALILFFAYAVNLLLGLLVAMVNGIAPGDVIPAAFGASGFLFLHFVMLYSVTVLAMVLTGNILVGILGTGVLHLYFPALLLLLDALYQEFFKTSYHGGSRIAYRLLDKSSPLPCMSAITRLYEWNERPEPDLKNRRRHSCHCSGYRGFGPALPHEGV